MRDFYPRPPRGGRRLPVFVKFSDFIISIHALREEGDVSHFGLMHLVKNFYPRPPRGGRPRKQACLRTKRNFYPRPPRGGRPPAHFLPRRKRGFLSTPSARRATKPEPQQHMEQKHFYPRPPRGGRQQKQRQNLYFLINYTTFCTDLEEL